MAASMPLLLTSARAQRQLGPQTGIVRCPPELANGIAGNGLEVAHETLSDGNCGLHAFAISLSDAVKRYRPLSRTLAFNKFHTPHKDPHAIVVYLRGLANDMVASPRR